MSDTAPIRQEERFDEERVSAYLQDRLPSLFEGPIRFDQVPGGAANLTYRAVDGRGQEFVLRRAPLGDVAKGGHDMEREHRVLSRLWEAFPLAPRSYHFCEDVEVMGKPFFVMERRRGFVVRRTWPEPLAGNTPAQRSVAEGLVDAIAALHSIDPAAVGLADLGRPQGFVQRQIDGWARRWTAAATREVEAMDELATRFPDLAPAPQRATILHNDFKLDNTMISSSGELVAVFDWDMATLGDPLVDAGTLLAYWAQPEDPTFAVFGANAVAIGSAMPKDEVRQRYAEASGLDITDIGFYESLALFRIAVIVEQIYARYLSGQTTDERFAAFEPLPPLLAEAAIDLL